MWHHIAVSSQWLDIDMMVRKMFIQLLFPFTFDFHTLEDSFILTNILTIEYSPFGGS